MRVVPEKTEARPGHRTAKNRQLRGMSVTLEMEIVGQFRVSARICQNRESARGDDHQSDGQAVQSIGEVDRIRSSHNHKSHKQKKRDERQRVKYRVRQKRVDQQIRMPLLEEWHV